MTDLLRLARSAISVAEDAGELALKSLGENIPSRPKGRFDLQVDADIDAENEIVPRLRRLIPGSEVASEEMTAPIDWGNPSVWIVDPLDGTNNYYASIPYLAISIALRQRSKLVMAVVHDPILRYSYSACVGHGAWRGNSKLLEASLGSIDRATVSLITNYSSAGRVAGEVLLLKLNSFTRRVITLWAPAADLVRAATGHIDGVVCIRALYGDVCSGLLILAEAGGTILGPSGDRLDVTNLDPTAPVSFVASASEAIACELWLKLAPDLDIYM